MFSLLRRSLLCSVAVAAVALCQAEDTPEGRLLRLFRTSTLCPVGDGAVALYGRPSSGPVEAARHFYRYEMVTGSFKRLTTDAEEAQIGRWGPEDLTYSRQTGQLAFVALDPDGIFGSKKIWLMDTRSGKIRVLVANGRNNDMPQFSPDGRKVAFFHSSADMELHKWEPGTKGFALSTVDVDTGRIAELAPEDNVPAPRLGPPCWSPDGQFLCFSASYARTTVPQVYKVSAAGGGFVQLTRDPKAGGGSPVWTLGGKILYYRAADSGIHQVLPDGTGDRLVFPCGLLTDQIELSPDRRKIAFEPGTSTPTPRGANLIVLDENGRQLSSSQTNTILGKWLP